MSVTITILCFSAMLLGVSFAIYLALTHLYADKNIVTEDDIDFLHDDLSDTPLADEENTNTITQEKHQEVSPLAKIDKSLSMTDINCMFDDIDEETNIKTKMHKQDEKFTL